MEEILQSFLKCIFELAFEERVGFKTGQCDMCYAQEFGLYPRDSKVPLEVLSKENNTVSWDLGNPSGRRGS